MTEHTPPPATNGHAAGAVLNGWRAEADRRRATSDVAQKAAEQKRMEIARLVGEDASDVDQLAAIERQAAEFRRRIGERREQIAAAQAEEMEASQMAERLRAEAEYMGGVVDRLGKELTDPAATRTDMPEVER